MTRFTAPIAEQIWDMKYRFKQADGTPIDTTVEDSWRRIAQALAAVETAPAEWSQSSMMLCQISNSCQRGGSPPVRAQSVV